MSDWTADELTWRNEVRDLGMALSVYYSQPSRCWMYDLYDGVAVVKTQRGLNTRKQAVKAGRDVAKKRSRSK